MGTMTSGSVSLQAVAPSGAGVSLSPFFISIVGDGSTLLAVGSVEKFENISLGLRPFLTKSCECHDFQLSRLLLSTILTIFMSTACVSVSVAASAR